MPSYAVSCRPGVRSALVPLLLACALPLGAQAQVHGTDINAAGETARDRGPLLFGGAFVAPEGAYGLSFQQSVAWSLQKFPEHVSGTSVRKREFISGMSGYWGVTPRLTLGASMALKNEYSEYSWPEGQAPAGAPFWGPQSARFAIGDLRAHARYQLLRSASGGTQLATNASVGIIDRVELGQRASASVGLALAQRLGPATLHLAPSVEAVAGSGPYAHVGAGLTMPVTRRISASVEGLFDSGRTRDMSFGEFRVIRAVPSALQAGGGLRFDFGKLALDAALRYGVQNAPSQPDVSRLQFLLGTHVKF
jgi:hypothetical protein